jgi:hypothetical protein
MGFPFLFLLIPSLSGEQNTIILKPDINSLKFLICVHIHERAIHSVGTFRGTSSKNRFVVHAAWFYDSWMDSPCGVSHVPVS